MVQARTPSDDHALQRIAVPRYGDAARQVLPIAILFLACILLALMLRAGPAQGETAPVSLPETIAVEDIPALFPGLDIEIAQEALTHYRFGRIAEGDALRDAITDEAADALLEWSAVRSSEMRDFARIAAFLRAHPDWSGRSLLRLRAEQAFVENRPRARAMFWPSSRRKSRAPAAGTCCLPRPCGDRARAMPPRSWPGGSGATSPSTRIPRHSSSSPSPPPCRRPITAYAWRTAFFAEDWTAAGRAARFAGEDFDTLVAARRALMRDPGGLDAALEAVPPALRNDSSLLFTQARRLRLDDDVRGAAAIIARAPRAISVIGNGDAWWVERRIVARNLLEEGEDALAYELVLRPCRGKHPAILWMRNSMPAGSPCASWAIPSVRFRISRRSGRLPQRRSRCRGPITGGGRALADLGDENGARQAFAAAAQHVTAFYGQLAHQTLDAGPLALPPLPAIDNTVIARRDAMLFTRAIVLLHALEAEDLAAALLGDLGRTLDDVALLRAFGELAQALDNPRALLGLSRSAVLRGLPLDKLAYPLGAVPDFPPVGPAVERALVYAIARQESAFDPQAVSPAGARGLMQFMPATARRVAQRYDVPFEESRLLGDPVYSAKLGAAHLGELLADWDGSAALAFAAYNAGPGHVRRWISRFGDPRRGGHDMIDWVEQIPFPETRSYVQRVMENLVIYRHRLGEERPLAIDAELRAMR